MPNENCPFVIKKDEKEPTFLTMIVDVPRLNECNVCKKSFVKGEDLPCDQHD